ncbi:hypothetical protein BN1095_6690001 [Clostridioides difficile]|uniref:Uncharacterized protein n=1 Tax=Clostridioides difficile TaxID=1496 RepID=A0A069AYL3_CLODI|nr:hypothetical protein BN1095_6690001 [Clostridioides difficile]
MPILAIKTKKCRSALQNGVRASATPKPGRKPSNPTHQPLPKPTSAVPC